MKSEFWFPSYMVASFEHGKLHFNTDDSRGFAACNMPCWNVAGLTPFLKWMIGCQQAFERGDFAALGKPPLTLTAA